MARLEFVHPLLSDTSSRYDGLIRVEDERAKAGVGEGTVILKVSPEIGSRKAVRAGSIPFSDMLAEATITSRYIDHRWQSARVSLTPSLSEASIQRLNRLLKGTDISVGWYHRTKDVRVRIPPAAGAKAGKRLPLPLTLDISRSAAGSIGISVKGAKRAPLKPAKTIIAEGKAKRAGEAVAAATARVAHPPKSEPIAAPEPFTGVSGGLKAKPSTTKVDPTGLFTYPTLRKSSEVVIERETLSGLDTLWDMHVKGVKQVVALTGPTGTGKTSLAYGIAARKGVGIMVFDAAGAREFSDWTGAMQLKDGKTEFVPSGFLEAIDADGRYAGQPRVVLIDELNRAESSGALNALIPVLHGFGSLYVPELGKSIDIDASVLIIATLNRGSAYAGTVGLDLALADRVTAWVEMQYLDKGRERALVIERSGVTESQAGSLVDAAHQVRRAATRGELPEGGGISTRRLLDAAYKVAGGMSLHQAAVWSWVGSYPSEGGSSSEAHVVKTVIDGILRQ